MNPRSFYELPRLASLSGARSLLRQNRSQPWRNFGLSCWSRWSKLHLFYSWKLPVRPGTIIPYYSLVRPLFVIGTGFSQIPFYSLLMKAWAPSLDPSPTIHPRNRVFFTERQKTLPRIKSLSPTLYFAPSVVCATPFKNRLLHRLRLQRNGRG